MTDDLNTEFDDNFELFPCNPERSLFIANAYAQLGAVFIIGNNDAKSIKIPLCTRCIGGIPNLPEARLHERFASDVEYRGAMKLLGYFVSRFSDHDLDHVFSALELGKRASEKDVDFEEQLPANNGGVS